MMHDEFVGGDAAGELFPAARRPHAIRIVGPDGEGFVVAVPPLSELSFDPVHEAPDPTGTP